MSVLATVRNQDKESIDNLNEQVLQKKKETVISEPYNTLAMERKALL